MQLFLGTGLAVGPLGRRGPGGAPDGHPSPHPPPAPPRAARGPALVGSGRVGEPLAVDPGTWTDARAFGFAWLKDGRPLAGAAGAAHVPAASDDRAALACRVTASGPGGATTAMTPAITIKYPPPGMVGSIPDLHYTQSSGSHVVDISPFFSGGSLEFSVTGAGVAIDPATGVITLDVAALVAGGTVTVAAANSGGRVELDLSLRLASPPVAIAPPTLSGVSGNGAVIGDELVVDPGIWAGQPAPELACEWRAGGVAIPGATGAVFVPGPAQDGAAIACRVTATNLAGVAVAETAAVVAAYAAPAATGTLPDLALARGTGPRSVAAGGAFDGGGLVFAVEGAGATIDAATGVVTIPTEAARLAAPVAVTATNSGGAARTGFAVTVQAAPAATAAPAPFAFARGAGSRTIDAASLFTGDALVFALESAPAGATIDAASGVVTVPTAAALSGAAVVKASNAVGAATQRLDLAVLAAPAALAAPAPVVLDLAPGAKALATAALFTGDALVFALESAPAGTAIDAASGVVTVPTAAALSGAVVVKASNAVGAATQRLAVEVRSALARPVALGAPAAAVFLQGAGVQTVSAQAFFAGDALVFALDAAPAGVTINPGSGLVSVPTAAALADAPVTVRASNAAGAATQTVTVAVRATRTVFDAAAALADVRFLFPSAAPAWTHNAGGFARLIPGADRAHGAWIHALGDGRYRALARWSAGAAAPQQSRPFGLIGRMTKSGANFQGVRVDAVLQTSGARVLQIRDYTGARTNSTTVRQAAVAWSWDAWWWLEAEFDGATVRARAYPEGAAAPDWQLAATTSVLAPGAFGPTSHVSDAGEIPVADIRRLEFLPLAAVAPAAASDGDWALDQITVKA